MRSLRIDQRETDGVAVLTLNGPLILGEEDSDFRDCLHRLIQAGSVRIVVNLQATGKIDSTGLGTLVSSLLTLKNAGGGLALCNLHSSHLELLILTKLLMVFQVFADEHTAVGSYFPKRETKPYDVLNFARQLIN